ncbi:TPR Domain containing protein [Loa loa]|uniref:TPR Domain containing protein n=1 Tax=Loa loa TaxID=7209 RepID=A0A1I7V6K0_LOALO|nr:TPR Domain containing protein [Loa loa]EFO23656.1 TPR Domain containing protein [Loa loa]
MAGTSKANDGDDFTSFGSSAKNVVNDINAKMEGNGGDDIVHKALNDDIQDGSNKDKSIPKQNDKEMDETKRKEGLEKRKEQEAALSEEELKNLREQSQAFKAQGNDHFGEGFWYEAAHSYTKALDICPLMYTSDRATYLSNRAAAYIKLRDWEKAIEDCSEALEIGAPNDKPLERRAHSYAQLEEKYEQAVEDYESLLKMYPNRKDYVKKIADLKQAINERNERMKREMISKLKDLGNMCLKPFGLSTDNFEMVQQPGGGYSISMKK